MNSFFQETDEQKDIDIDMKQFTKLLAEYTGNYRPEKMKVRMKEIYRNRELLFDFIDRLKIDLKYLIELTYFFDCDIITPQLVTELKGKLKENSIYPYYE